MAHSINFRPSSVLTLIFLACVVYATFASANPVPESADDITKQVLNDPVKAWKDNEKHKISTGDGESVELSTRDIILISVGAFLILLILVCCIGYCLCECMKKLICCICCCE